MKKFCNIFITTNIQRIWRYCNVYSKINVNFIFIYCSFNRLRLETKTFTEFYKNDLEDVTKIQVQDGSTGYSKITTDKKVIGEFLSKIKDVQFIPEENQEDRTGFLYFITLYQDEEMTFIFTLNEVNDYYYYTEPDIYQ